jgi:D-alanine transaminase
MSDRILASWNGEIKYLDEINISPLDRGFVFGDGIYEVIRIYNGKFWLFDEHFSRLKYSLDQLDIRVEISTLRESIYTLFEKSKVQNGIIYLQVTRGTAPRTHYFPNSSVPTNCLIWCNHYDDSWLNPFWSNGIKVISTPETRWARRDIKTINLLPNCLAMEKAKKLQFQEAIFVEKCGLITEATSNNVFGVKDEIIFTSPKSNKILPGITRDYVLKKAKLLGFKIEEKPFTLNQAYEFDEFFLSGSVMEIMPVVKIDDYPIRDGKVGKITKILIDNFFNDKKI